jgi:hypothetical protein
MPRLRLPDEPIPPAVAALLVGSELVLDMADIPLDDLARVIEALSRLTAPPPIPRPQAFHH